MNLIFFAHPPFLGHQSMPRYASLLASGMIERGHNVEVWQPESQFIRASFSSTSKKWLGYIDQYVAFPVEVRKRLKTCPDNTLFVFLDNALGPWVPLVAHRPHVIHCHDFLAQRSAMGQIPQNPTSLTGRLYQQYIRRGYKKGQHFISVSEKTQRDLHQFTSNEPKTSTVIYNGLNRSFSPVLPSIAREALGLIVGIDLSAGYILHIGGNQWYKNRVGVIDIYDAWCQEHGCSLPLLLIGQLPTRELLNRREQSLHKNYIYFKSGINDDIVQQAYAGATCLLFPSITEGFGWPIIEAMACRCPVITTNEAPMTEVGGEAAFYTPGRPVDLKLQVEWESESAHILQKIVALSNSEREQYIEKGLKNCVRFETKHMLDSIEECYRQILLSYN